MRMSADFFDPATLLGSNRAWYNTVDRALILYSLGAALRKQRFRDRTGFLAHHPGPAVFLRLSKPELSPHFEV